MEASHAVKAVITCSDSEGVLDLVTDGRTGIVAEPNSESLSRALSKMTSDCAEAKMMGSNAKDAIEQISPNWNTTIDRLLS